MEQETEELLVLDKHETEVSPELTATTEPRLECMESRVIALDEETRRVKHVISTGKLDRNNRIVEPGGWRLARFKKNPVVLADHEYSIERIIGRAVETKVEGDALVSTTEFEKEGLGNVAFRLLQAGMVKAWSVGWMGLKTHRIGEDESCERCKEAGAVQFGTHFVRQELLEYSLVAIPANPDAVMGLQAAGLVAETETDEWVEMTAEPPQRSTEFYNALFSARRTQARRAAALLASQCIRRVEHE